MSTVLPADQRQRLCRRTEYEVLVSDRWDRGHRTIDYLASVTCRTCGYDASSHDY